MEDKKKMILKVTKSYTRKVSLKAISSQFDNICLGTYFSAPIEFTTEEDFNKKCNILAEKARKETERDMRVAIESLLDLAKDDHNSVLLGIGRNIDSTPASFLSSQIEGFDTIVAEETVTLPDEFDEVDAETLDI